VQVSVERNQLSISRSPARMSVDERVVAVEKMFPLVLGTVMSTVAGVVVRAFVVPEPGRSTRRGLFADQSAAQPVSGSTAGSGP